MSKLFKLKAIINKSNKQINFNLPKKELPQKLKDIIKKNNLHNLNFRLEGWD